MSRRGNPYDNAQAESFIKTLKYEEVYRNEYLDFADSRRRIGKFIESVYNQKRLHSALGYLPPAEFERQQLLLPAEARISGTLLPDVLSELRIPFLLSDIDQSNLHNQDR